MSADLNEIRDALAKATPGPWEIDYVTEIDLEGAFDLAHVWASDPDGDGGVAIAPSILRADAHLIANAPAWLAELCDRAERAEAAIERVRKWHSVADCGDATCEHCPCESCGWTWPCPTLRALDGAQ